MLDALRGTPAAARRHAKQLLTGLIRPDQDQALGKELATFAANWEATDIPAALARYAGSGDRKAGN